MELFKVNCPQTVTSEQLDDLLCAAFEGGINYWCNGLKIADRKGCKYAHEVVSKDGQILLFYHDGAEKQNTLLTLEKMKSGIEKVLEKKGVSWLDFFENHDANDADNVVQYAVFGELVYG